jgi:hypothetical protein
MNSLIRKILFLSLLFISCSLPPILSQTSKDKAFIRAVQEADLSFYYNEDFDKAALQYEAIIKNYPDNLNIISKLGTCYLSVDGRKADALKLLKKASANVVKNDDEYLEYGQKAPLDTWFYLAHAYHVNDSLKQAIDLYTEVKRKTGSKEAFRIEYIDNQIKACRYAIEMQKNPVRISTNLLFPWLSSWSGAKNPVISANDSVFIFTHKTDGVNHIYCSYKSKGWQKPVDITSQLGGFDNICSNSITSKGEELILYMDDGADGNLYSSMK